jgi:hypothetical protein
MEPMPMPWALVKNALKISPACPVALPDRCRSLDRPFSSSPATDDELGAPGISFIESMPFRMSSS